MTIGEDHPVRRIDGKMYRRCYGNKWLRMKAHKIPNAYYEGERDENGLLIRGSYAYHEIVFIDNGKVTPIPIGVNALNRRQGEQSTY